MQMGSGAAYRKATTAKATAAASSDGAVVDPDPKVGAVGVAVVARPRAVKHVSLGAWQQLVDAAPKSDAAHVVPAQ